MPKFFAEKHNYYFQNYIKNSNNKVVYKTLYVFCRDKIGYIFPVWILIKQCLNLTGIIFYLLGPSLLFKKLLTLFC